MKLAGAGVQSAQDIDVGYGSATIGAADREELIAGAQLEVAKNLELGNSKSSRSFGSEPKDRSNDPDLHTGQLGPANVLQFRGGVSFQSAPQELDKSYRVAQPQQEAWNSRISYSSAPVEENSVATRLRIGRDGAVSLERRAA